MGSNMSEITKNAVREFDTAIAWSVAKGETTSPPHPIKDYMPVVSTIFPNIKYYGALGFQTVFTHLANPVMRSLHPGLLDCATERDAIAKFGEKLPIPAVQTSNGYEWQNSQAWRNELDRKISAGIQVRVPQV